MAKVFLPAFYRPKKSAWASIIEPGQNVSNLVRLNISEGTNYTYLFSFELKSGGYFPASVSDNMSRYNNFCIANPANIKNGGDLKWRGNYIHTKATLISINGDKKKTGALYYSGWNDYTGEENITLEKRNWVEVLTNVNFSTDLVANQLVVLGINDGNKPMPPPLLL